VAALSASFTGWRIPSNHGNLKIEAACAGAATFYRGAIATAAVASNLIKISNAVTTDIPYGIVEKQTVTTGASSHTIPCWINGVIWFTGVAAIAAATGFGTVYQLASSDNPADLTATAAGNTSAFGRIIMIEVTAVSGYIDQGQKAVTAETA
jgi:hypothetical protein